MNTISNYIKNIGLLIIFSFALSSCNKDFPNILKEDYGSTEASVSKSKVLLVVVDGLRGNIISDLEPDNIRVIARNSLHTNNSLGDFASDNYNKSIGLANIFTGVKEDKHQVDGDDLSKINLDDAPTFINRLKAGYDDFSSEAYTSSNDVKEYLLNDIDHTEVLATDADIVSKVKSSLATTESSLIVAHLNNPYLVGEAKSYETEEEAYKQAVFSLDEQMGELVNAVNDRPEAKNENWLVIFTSSIGGVIAEDFTNDDDTAFGDSKLNTFTYFYSPKFSRKYIAKPSSTSMPFQGAGMRLLYSNDGADAMSARLADVSKLNITGTQNATITFFFKQNEENTVFNYPPILMKRSGIDSGPGWQFIMSGGEVELAFTGGGGKFKSANVTDGKWHVITLVIDRATNKAKVFTDGVLSGETSAGSSDATNNEPVIFGKHPANGSGGDFTVCNLQFYNIAMTDEEVALYSGLALVDEKNSPYHNSLLGYWPIYEDNGASTLTDVTGKAGDMRIFNKSSWSTFDEYVPFIIPYISENTYQVVPNGVDIATFVYQWFGIIPLESWGLAGKAWTPPYRILEY